MDVKCAICGEPWENYGYPDNGDMKPWEWELFKKGAGCPSCQGKCETDHTIEHLKSVVIDGGENPDEFELLHNPEQKRPEWKRPENPVLFQCAGCDSKIVRDLDFGEKSEFARHWDKPTIDRKWYHERELFDENPVVEENTFEINGKRYCPGCVKVCDGPACHAIIFRSNESCTGTVLFGDTYDPGSSFAHPDDMHDTICVDCFEKIPTCSHCGATMAEDDEHDLCESCRPEEEPEEDDPESLLNTDKDP